MFTKKNWEQLLTLLLRLRLMLYSASWKQSEKYYDDGDDEQYPYDCAKVEKDKAKEPQYDEYRSDNEKQIK